jgi:hypothetical protein
LLKQVEKMKTIEIKEELFKKLTDLRTRTDYQSPDEVNADIDRCIELVKKLLKQVEKE